MYIKKKTCYVCKETKNITEFYKDGKTKKGYIRYMRRCKECDNLKQRKNSVKTDSYRKELRNWLNQLKEDLICKDCNLSFKGRTYLCDFHHLDPKTKDSAISTAITYRWSKEAIVEELKKCVPLCANCHRTRHKTYKS